MPTAVRPTGERIIEPSGTGSLVVNNPEDCECCDGCGQTAACCDDPGNESVPFASDLYSMTLVAVAEFFVNVDHTPGEQSAGPCPDNPNGSYTWERVGVASASGTASQTAQAQKNEGETCFPVLDVPTASRTVDLPGSSDFTNTIISADPGCPPESFPQDCEDLFTGIGLQKPDETGTAFVRVSGNFKPSGSQLEVGVEAFARFIANFQCVPPEPTRTISIEETVLISPEISTVQFGQVFPIVFQNPTIARTGEIRLNVTASITGIAQC